ncbi:MAG TPA: nuclear transport factor 2 family protein [Methylomirabilota bacterium]|jgi:ketosteroid isomerase-like protein|nr:nuclear transport factor 2 family protein [Methylomirabilota bacterium]
MAIQRAAKNAKAVRRPAKVAKKPARRAQHASRSIAARRSERTITISDYEGARQLLSRYCFALDSGRLDELGALFHRDAAFSVSFEQGQQHTGRDTIQAWYGRFYEARPGQFRHTRHKIFEPLLSINGDTATSSTYFDADSIDPDGNVRVISGRYDDVMVREQGQWFFKDRKITVLYHYSPGKGEEGMVS